jgi:UDP-N-acetylglucosamine 4,6-dehydratase|tara:strand:- start:327 stop:1301 length:975 start_codon:yes stop_codon:yes gene_type:complete
VLKGDSILVTGGTGSFGQAFVKYALNKLDPRRIIIYSRDEVKQLQMRKELGEDPRLRFFIGDVREPTRLQRALQGVDSVIHCAALKQVDTAEYNPIEYIKTNVFGAENLINASIDAGVRQVLALSTDKASSPINLYGASKLCADKLFVAANHYSGGDGTRFSVVRYGNVAESRGSVIPLFQELASSGVMPVTDRRMTRFWVTLDDAVQFVIDSAERMRHGGELFVPRIPSTKITDLAEAVAPGCRIEEIGIRPGEKLHEEMISVEDSRRTRVFDDHYLMRPVLAAWEGEYVDLGEPAPEGFCYRSDLNEDWLSVEQIRELLHRS